MTQSPKKGTAVAQPIDAGSMQVVLEGEGVFEAGPLGAGIALSLHDPVARVSGMLYFLLPRRNPAPGGTQRETSLDRSLAYAMDAIPEFLRRAFELGATREGSVLCAAGGARMIGDNGAFQIGRRNRAMLRRLLLRAGIRIAAEEVGRTRARTLLLSVATGTARVLFAGEEKVLWKP